MVSQSSNSNCTQTDYIHIQRALLWCLRCFFNQMQPKPIFLLRKGPNGTTKIWNKRKLFFVKLNIYILICSFTQLWQLQTISFNFKTHSTLELVCKSQQFDRRGSIVVPHDFLVLCQQPSIEEKKTYHSSFTHRAIFLCHLKLLQEELPQVSHFTHCRFAIFSQLAKVTVCLEVSHRYTGAQVG